MAFTTLTIVRAHLQATDVGKLSVHGQPVTLTGTDPAQLPHQNLAVKSETVKWDPQVYPVIDGPHTLRDFDWSDLSSGHVVPHSDAVIVNLSLASVYAPEADYKLDYVNGRIRRTAGTAIPNQQDVLVCFNAYSLFERDTDYLMDEIQGTVKRTAGSAIPDGAEVLVDYDVESGGVTDGLVEQAIVEAQDLIVRALSPEYNGSSPDQGLQTGATQLVLAIVARDMAAAALLQRRATDAGGRAGEWQNLAGLYEARAWHTLRPFLVPYQIHSPERRANA